MTVDLNLEQLEDAEVRHLLRKALEQLGDLAVELERQKQASKYMLLYIDTPEVTAHVQQILRTYRPRDERVSAGFGDLAEFLKAGL